VTKQTRQIVMLVALVGVFGTVMAYQFWPADTTTSVTVPSNPKEAGGAAGTLQVAHVNMDRLQAAAAEAGGAEKRDPFRFKPKPLPAAATAQQQNRPMGPFPAAPPPPPTDPRPEIRMKYLGYATAPNGTRIAVLQDDPNHPTVMAKQGDVIDGMYRLLRVDTNEVELSYLDGARRRRFVKGQ
jgi:hypothetical protein